MTRINYLSVWTLEAHVKVEHRVKTSAFCYQLPEKMHVARPHSDRNSALVQSSQFGR